MTVWWYGDMIWSYDDVAMIYWYDDMMSMCILYAFFTITTPNVRVTTGTTDAASSNHWKRGCNHWNHWIISKEENYYYISCIKRIQWFQWLHPRFQWLLDAASVVPVVTPTSGVVILTISYNMYIPMIWWYDNVMMSWWYNVF